MSWGGRPRQVAAEAGRMGQLRRHRAGRRERGHCQAHSAHGTHPGTTLPRHLGPEWEAALTSARLAMVQGA